ncbi:hypothetical protein KTT_53230 [Tengunoibacter tsumagoiensis]|uniref:Uncharacterized protein n=1 Tax=Tengunoibacter tsumagoiensis TaxID=2014871 RepID=A0A402A8H3_9CHLR|nr:hypothetical protein KTT_53230 [Tengunoibacter tsumagoiensis]
MPGESVRCVNVNEKMPSSQKRFERTFVLMRADMAARGYTQSYVTVGDVLLANASPG